MKRVAGLCIVVLCLAACAGSKPSIKEPPKPVPAIPAGFADVPMMLSSRSVDPTTMNVEIGAAARRNEEWVRDPSQVVLRLSKTGEAPRVRLHRLDNRVEAPDTSTVTVIMDRLLDDAIDGIWAQYTLARGTDGSWRVASLRQAIKARRGSDTETYRAEPAP